MHSAICATILVTMLKNAMLIRKPVQGQSQLQLKMAIPRKRPGSQPMKDAPSITSMGGWSVVFASQEKS